MRTLKHRWSSAIGTSLACHAVAIGIITGLMLLFPPALPERGPIEVDLVTMSGGGGGGGGSDGKSQEEELPKIKSAEATPTAPPPPVETEPEPEAENDVHEIAAKPSEETAAKPASEGTADSAEESSGSGTGSGGGHGSGTGTGTGSGEGTGSGSGSGGGIGSGNGDGVGDGDGSGETMGPQLLSNPAPAYPESCRKANISGTTVVGLTIGTDGSVVSAWVASSSGNDTLDSAAVNAVYGWQFVPAKQNGVPITCNSQVPVTFNLRG